MTEYEWMERETRNRIEGFISSNEKPDWCDWFGMYPAKSAVDASKVQLAAINETAKLTSLMEAMGDNRIR